jgi:hypothetical protein
MLIKTCKLKMYRKLWKKERKSERAAEMGAEEQKSKVGSLIKITN